jgi:hypothetical protein
MKKTLVFGLLILLFAVPVFANADESRAFDDSFNRFASAVEKHEFTERLSRLKEAVGDEGAVWYLRVLDMVITYREKSAFLGWATLSQQQEILAALEKDIGSYLQKREKSGELAVK